MRIFLAGASGAIGRRLVPLLLQAGHEVTGTTRSAETGGELTRAGVTPAVLDVFDPQAVADAMRATRPAVVIHQLTDLPRELDEARISASYSRNARIRTEGTRNLIAGAVAASASRPWPTCAPETRSRVNPRSVRRFIVQSIAFAYLPAGEPHPETDPLNLADPARAVTVKGAAEMERLVLESPGFDGIVLRYGLLYGPGTWTETAGRKPALHVDASAQAALLAVTRGAPGVYNIADDDGVVSIAKARAERLRPRVPIALIRGSVLRFLAIARRP